jgi:hypothetical protein
VVVEVVVGREGDTRAVLVVAVVVVVAAAMR